MAKKRERDPLEELDGVGPKTLERLRELGVTSVEHLSDSTVVECWRAASRKYDVRFLLVSGEAARAVAEAIYYEMGVERWIEVKYDKKDVPYIRLTNVDLGLLGLGRRK